MIFKPEEINGGDKSPAGYRRKAEIMKGVNLMKKTIKDLGLTMFPNARFRTKFTEYSEHNGEIVDIIAVYTGKDTRYDIRFMDGTIGKNIYDAELTEMYL